LISTYTVEVLPSYSPNLSLNQLYVERLIKFLLWQRGGWRLHVGGPAEIGRYIQELYRSGGRRQFDAEFMSRIYEHSFTVVVSELEAVPEEKERFMALGRHLDGCRIGFDLGASDRKVSAVIEGQVVYSEETPWDPRHASDPEYHYAGIVDSIRRALEKLPRLDAVGGSAAGVYINDRVRVASLFRAVSQEDFDRKIVNLFLRIREELGVPLVVVNDGEVTALAGSMSLGENPVLGIAMGSSQAAGYVNAVGNITTWLNELAFAPVDYRSDAPTDEWSGDAGCGVQYFSQVAAIRLAEGAGIRFPSQIGLPEKLVILQEQMASGDMRARQVYETIGCYLGYGVAHYSDFYQMKHVLILGRVTTGLGGEIILQKALEVLRLEFADLSQRISIALPDESNRRVGQSIAAASLPRAKGVHV
jgi:predicted NBD/HSP70 family sugar kinase